MLKVFLMSLLLALSTTAMADPGAVTNISEDQLAQRLQKMANDDTWLTQVTARSIPENSPVFPAFKEMLRNVYSDSGVDRYFAHELLSSGVAPQDMGKLVAGLLESLMQKGLLRLSDDEIYGFIAAFTRMVQHEPVDICANNFRKRESTDAFKAMLRYLYPDDIASLLRIMSEAAIAQANDYPAASKLTRDQSAVAVHVFGKTLASMLKNQGDVDRYLKTAKSFASASDIDACWAGVTTLQAMLNAAGEPGNWIRRNFVSGF